MSPALRAALADWLAWVERGAPDGEPYWRHVGLCYSVHGFGLPQRIELQDLFESQGLDRRYPFGKTEYHYRYDNNTQHECPKRLAWVRKMLEEGANHDR